MACRPPPMPLRPMVRGRLRPGAVTMDTQRLILLFIFGFSVLMLWEAWEKEHRPKPAATTAPAMQQSVPTPSKPPAGATAAAPTGASSVVPQAGTAAEKGETIRVRTDLLLAEIDTVGGSLKRVELLQHKEAKDATKNFVLLGNEHQYEAQSGLTGDGNPN